MSVDSNELLRVLPPFQNKERTIIDDQDTGDIARYILQRHKDYADQYDKIYSYFAGEDDEETAKNVFDFLKRNVNYIPEKKTNQLIKSPSAIIATGKTTGSDCKNYALFSNGVLDAYRRNEQRNFDVIYRFASYDDNQSPQHVFSVIRDGQGNEVWIDPVLNQFDCRIEPTYITDKIVSGMALKSLSGVAVDQYDNYPMVKRYHTGNAAYGNNRNANSVRYAAPSSKGNSGIGSIDYTPYIVAAVVAFGLYIALK